MKKQNKILILTKKELTDILRDKKTLIIMIVMPLLIYPFLLVGMTLVMTMLIQGQMDTTHVIAYDEADEKYINELMEIYDENTEDIGYTLKFSPENDGTEADAYIYFSDENGVINVSVSYSSTNESSEYAQEGLYSLVKLYREKLLSENLESKGLSEDFIYPVIYEGIDTATAGESMGMNIGGSIGMLLIMTIFMGAFYPTIDVTTGEKERGTLETLLTLPVTNFQMIMSKYIAVSILACITALISIIALGGSVMFMIFGVPSEYTGGLSDVPVGAFLEGVPVLFLAVVATALLITALSMSLCIFAKSTKEANNYMSPVMMVVMIASMVGIFPSVTLDYKTSLIPIVNVSLLVKQILSQQLNLSLAGITVLVNAGCSVIAIWLISRIYDSEDVLFNDGFHSFRIFQKRSEIKKGTMPDTGDIILCLAVLLILMIYISVIVGTRSLFAGTVVTQLSIFAIPVLIAWYMKSDKRELFSLRRPKLKSFFICLLLYFATYLFINIISSVLTLIFEESTEALEESYALLIDNPFIMVAFVMAVMPAIGEELLFRGLVFGGFKHKYGAKKAMLASALIFGAYHMSLVKLIPTALLGLCFAYVVEKSKSIFTSMFLHFLNNFVSVVAMKYYYAYPSGVISPPDIKELFIRIGFALSLTAVVYCYLDNKKFKTV